MDEILSRIYYHNTVLDYIIAACIIVLGSTFIHFIKRRPLRRIKAWAGRTESRYDDILVDSVERFGVPVLHFLVIYMGIRTLVLPARGDMILHIAVTVAITYFFIRLISSLVSLLLRYQILRQDGGEEKIKHLGGLMLIINLALWVVGALFLFSNMGYDITAVIAGLGIGGIAIALAAQNILGDLFNYFVIFFDRPFEVGDFVVVDQKAGTVEHIGIKTTRIKALSGEQLVFANTDLTSSRLHNFKRMNTRRIVFKFGVTYQTSLEDLHEIPNMIRGIIDDLGDIVRYDRAHFLAYGESSLDFEVVYIINSSEYNTYMDIQQKINLELFRIFRERGIDFAYPTRTLYMVKEEASPEPVA